MIAEEKQKGFTLGLFNKWKEQRYHLISIYASVQQLAPFWPLKLLSCSSPVYNSKLLLGQQSQGDVYVSA